jgi:hypothetical protein
LLIQFVGHTLIASFSALLHAVICDAVLAVAIHASRFALAFVKHFVRGESSFGLAVIKALTESINNVEAATSIDSSALVFVIVLDSGGALVSVVLTESTVLMESLLEVLESAELEQPDKKIVIARLKTRIIFCI